MEKQWELAEYVDVRIVEKLCRGLELPPVIARLLVLRGITSVEEAERFFHPERTEMHDPFLFNDMQAAVDRIEQALSGKEPILVFGDYDVDGITAASLLYLFFRDLGGDVRYYIPNRQSEGYGLSLDGVEVAAREGARLLITVDCGITSLEEVRLANERELEVIISDHHQPGPEIPPALAVINPKVSGSNYPFTDLAGVGVAYKLAQGVALRMGLDPGLLDNYIDLVAVGTAADIVPLVDENRIFVRLGLKKLNQDPLIGIRALIETAGLRAGDLDVSRIIYGLAPRINAVGRLGSAGRAVEMLITSNFQTAMRMAQVLETENRNRRTIDTGTLEEAVQQVEQTHDLAHDRAIVLAKENWHSGVIGIVASRLIERYYRPTVMITIENGIGKGSARSIHGFDVFSALQECSDLLLQFGGHTYAAGLSIEEERIPEFRSRFLEVAGRMLSGDDLVPKLHIDVQLDLGKIDRQLMKWLKLFAPFGPQNLKPRFISRAIALNGYPRIVGSNHLKFRVRSEEGSQFDCIGFNLGDLMHRLDPIRPTNNIVYNLEENNWGGRINLQLRVQDVKNDSHD